MSLTYGLAAINLQMARIGSPGPNILLNSNEIC